MCDYNTCCRLCLHEVDGGLNCLNVPRFISAIKQIFGFEVTTKDKCSTKICQECMKKISSISMYRDFVLNNQTTIEDYQNFRSNILTLKNESFISDDEDVIFLCEEKPTEEPSNITTKELRKISPISTKQKKTGTTSPKVDSPIKLKDVLCEMVDLQKEKQINIAHKHDVLEAISENDSVDRLDMPLAIGKRTQTNFGICYPEAIKEEKQQSQLKVSRQTELIRKEDKIQPATNVSSSKTVKETPQPPVDSNLIRKELTEQAATEVSTNNNNANIKISKVVSETGQSLLVETALLKKILSNNNGLNMEISKTLSETPQSPVHPDLIRKEVKEQVATNYNGANGINKTFKIIAKPPVTALKSVPLNKTNDTPQQQAKELISSSNLPLVNKTIINTEKKIRKSLPKNVLPTKKQKLETNSAPVSTQNATKSTTNINFNTSQKTSLNAVTSDLLSTSKALPTLPISIPVTIVPAKPLTPGSKSSAVQIYSINPPTFTTLSSQISAANPLQQNQKVVGPSVTTTTTYVDSEYVSLKGFGQQFGAAITQASNVLLPTPSTTSYSKPQQEKPLNPGFERMRQQQTVSPKIQSVAPNNIISPGIRPLPSNKRNQMCTNLNTHITSAALNSNTVKVNEVNKFYINKPSIKTMHLPYTNAVSASYNSDPPTKPTNSTGRILCSTIASPHGGQQNINMCQSKIVSKFQSPMCNKIMQQNRSPVWNGNETQNTIDVSNLSYTQEQEAETSFDSLIFSIRLFKFNNEIQIKISNQSEEINFNNMKKYQLDAVRKSILQPSSMSQICKAFKASKPDVYSKELLKKLGIDSLFFKV